MPPRACWRTCTQPLCWYTKDPSESQDTINNALSSPSFPTCTRTRYCVNALRGMTEFIMPTQAKIKVPFVQVVNNDADISTKYTTCYNIGTPLLTNMDCSM